MLEALPFITPAHIAFVPIVIALTQVFKGFVESPKWNRFIPLVAIVVSIGLCAILGGGLLPVIVGGIVVGLTACGMYSASATIKNG